MKSVDELKQELKKVEEILHGINSTKNRIRTDIRLNANNQEIRAHFDAELRMAVHSAFRAEAAIKELKEQIRRENYRIHCVPKKSAVQPTGE